MPDFAPAIPEDRVVRLQGAQNFREVGGYPARNGRRMRRGMIWRSARLDALSDEDAQRIDAIGICAIADLRGAPERNAHPTHAALRQRVTTYSWDTPNMSADQFRAEFFQTHANPDHHLNMVLGLYRTLADHHAVHLGETFAAIAGGETPMLIHCTAGKDRTGVAVALLLELIGVEREHVLADYALTERLLDVEKLGLAAALGVGLSAAQLDRLDAQAMRHMFRSDPRYLTAALDDIETRFGSVQAFAIQRLSMTEKMIDDLVSSLTEPA